MLERVVYFDQEILELYQDDSLDFPPDIILDEFEFDLAKGISLVLTPFKVFTKFVQKKNDVTLAYLPHFVDRLVSELAPGSFRARLEGATEGVLQSIEDFQGCLVNSLRSRFGNVFEGESLALAAIYLLKGRTFSTSGISRSLGEYKRSSHGEDLNDLTELLPEGIDEQTKDLNRATASYALQMARIALDQEDDDVNPLEWWPLRHNLSCLYPLAKLLFGIPASSS